MNQYPETSTTLADLSGTLRFIRKTRQMKLREVADISDLSLSFVSDLERGRTQPSLKTLEKLSTAYNTPITINIRP